MKKHEIAKYIGLKWGLGASGPDAYDCHHLVIELQKKIYNKELPSVAVNAASLRDIVKKISKDKVWDRFEKIDSPEDGCIVKLFTAVNPDHIGLYIDIDGGGIIHSLRHTGVVFDTVFILQKTYSKLEFFRYKG